jgi:glutaredoxin/glutathione-dependent peroxiredoxin
MPGAYTRVCSTEHMPGYLSSVSEFTSLGIDNVVVMTTNDRHVNEAWGATYGLNSAESPITIVSDGDGDLAKAMGLAEDMGFGVGVRTKRFAMVVNDGSVSTLLTDEGLNDCNQTSAQNLLRVIQPDRSVEPGDGNAVALALLSAVAVLALSLLLSINTGGENNRPIRDTANNVPAQRVIQQKSKSFNLLNDYL